MNSLGKLTFGFGKKLQNVQFAVKCILLLKIDFFLVVVQGQLLTVKYVILQSLISTSAVMQGFRLVVDLPLVKVMLFNVVSSVMCNQSISQRSKVSFSTLWCMKNFSFREH